MTHPTSVRRVSAARWGVAALFVANAIVFASIATRYPELKETFGLGELTFGLIVACGPVGSIFGSMVAGRMVARLGAISVAVGSSATLGLLLVGVGFVGHPVLLAAALFVIGFADATGDVGNNAHGLDVQRLMGRSIIVGLHGAWSAGAIAGGLVGLGALQLAVPASVQFAVVGGAIVVGSLVALTTLGLPEPVVHETTPATSGRSRLLSAVLLAACGVAVIGAFLEDLGSTWGGVFLVQEAGADIADSAFPFVALMAALTLGRFVADPLVDRFGPVATVRLGAASAFLGVLAVGAVPAQAAVIVGFALVGLGVAPMIPLAMAAAERAPGLGRGTGLAIAATLMRVGMLASPLLVGAISEVTGLRVAVLLCLVVPVVALLLARALRPPQG
ncbi:MFS transporter [Protaetiibacter sp. SSC-01]|uniref:MFS transporter n=1 Tax=Protaetiibacter sp. SSC-01 TaxID=2759943 RepID=UPI0016575F37|nr:MFS transporter [Protaetiibacter sp. SSC-01]QNO38121.1 MFS transporter [Protaetiibacter sp. SSC-01]